jgi:GTP-binding protein
VAFDQPGTTRDAVMVPFERDGERYTLIDTAGLRRRSRVEEAVEKFSVIKTLQAIETANVVVAVMDAHENVAEQDASLLGMAIEQGKALVLAVNKWDNIPTEQRDEIRAQVEQRLKFADFRTPSLHIRAAWQRRRRAAAHGPGGLRRGDARHEHARVDPGARGGHRQSSAAARERAAHQAPLCPPGRPQSARDRDPRQSDRSRARRVSALPGECLPRGVRSQGTPVRVVFRGEENPFAGKRNPLTPRQRRKRKRLIQRNKR